MRDRTSAAGRVIGGRIRDARLARGLSHEEVGRLARVHPTSMSFIERGYQVPRVEQLVALARVFGTSVADLLGPVDSPKWNGNGKAKSNGRRRGAAARV